MLAPFHPKPEDPPARPGVRWVQLIASAVALALTIVALLVAMNGQPLALPVFAALAIATAELSIRASRR